MGERKVLNKYYPPDFDPALIPRNRRPKDKQDKVRMMMPMSVRCNTCHEYIYKGKKFNSRKETVIGEDYLGIKIFRFYMRCPKCSAEFTIKTDPQNMDYTAEHGVCRNFEPWRENEKLSSEARRLREEEEFGDAMKVLENKTRDNKIEMDILDALDEHRALKEAQRKLTTEDVLAALRARNQEVDRMAEADEEIVKSIVFRSGNLKVTEESSDGYSSDSDGDEQDGALKKEKRMVVDPTIFLVASAENQEDKKASASSSSLISRVQIVVKEKKDKKDKKDKKEKKDKKDKKEKKEKKEQADHTEKQEKKEESSLPNQTVKGENNSAAANPAPLASLLDYGSGDSSQ